MPLKTFITTLLITLLIPLNGRSQINLNELQRELRQNIENSFSPVGQATENCDTCKECLALHAEFSKMQGEKYRFFQTKYKTDAMSFDHRSSVFNWQLLSGKIIFSVVILIVLCGLFFSGIHFLQSVKIPSKKVAKNKEVAPQAVEMEITTGGIKLNSSLIGIIILTISLAFFFLYLNYVFPINEMSFDPEPNKAIYEE